MVMASHAQTAVDGVSVTGMSMERNGNYMAVDMTLGMEDLDVSSNRAVVLTPRLANAGDSVDLPSVGVYGRRRHYYYVRNGESMITGKDEMSYRASKTPGTISYHQVVPYEDWMDGATLSLHREDYGCCNTLLAEQDAELGHHKEAFFPELVYVSPQREAGKTRTVEGSAFVDFPVNQTSIQADYRRNAVELGRIQADIDSVKGDGDARITSVVLKGYASPEGTYAHNKELAAGRTDALKQYIQQFYHFDSSVMTTGYEAEDWEGLRRYVDSSNISHRTEILALIDSDLEPDAKEAEIKSSYPQEYKFLLDNCYPSLRHTDYRIGYEIRTYTDVEEIRRLTRERPQNLSLNEFYLAAEEYEPGSKEFSDVFETAVRMYPYDAAANLNAANAAMRRDDLTKAARYLERAGDSAEAVYARGALAIRQKDYDTAAGYLKEAKSLGLEQAGVTLDQLEQGRR